MPSKKPAGSSKKLSSSDAEDATTGSLALTRTPVLGDPLEIVPGKRGSVDETIGHLFVKRSSAVKASRRTRIGLISLTGVGLLYLGAKMHLVPEGHVLLTLDDGVPKVYGPGRHVLMSPLEVSMGVVPLTDRLINVGPLYILLVDEDEFGLATEMGRPLILGPGVHVFRSAYFEFVEFKKQSDRVIQHGDLHRIIIPQGARGLAWDGEVPLLLEAGIYTKKSSIFTFVKMVEVDQQDVHLDPFRIVTVSTGQVGICFSRGKLVAMRPGEHFLNGEENQVFAGFLPASEQVRQLKQLDVLTSDGLLVRVEGSVTFRVDDPVLAITNIGADTSSTVSMTDATKDPTLLAKQLFKTVMKRCNDTLASLLTGTEALSSVGLGFGGSANKDLSGMDEAERDAFAAGELQQRQLNKLISSQFQRTLSDELRRDWGVQLTTMNVVDIEVMDENVRAALAEGVRCNIEAVTERRNAESRAETERILAAGRRDASKIATDAQTYDILEVASAQKKAGDLLQETPVAVELRLAETAAAAVTRSTNTVIVPDASMGTLMSVVGAASRVHASGKLRQPVDMPPSAPSNVRRPLSADKQQRSDVPLREPTSESSEVSSSSE